MDPRGPLPASKSLRRALFDDVEAFFPECRHRAGSEETFAEFARRVSSGDVSLLPLGAAATVLWIGSATNRNGALRTIGGLLSALLTPAAIEATAPLPTTAVGRAVSMMLRGARSCSGRSLLDVLARHRGSIAGSVVVAVTDSELTDESGRACSSMVDGQALLCNWKVDSPDGVQVETLVAQVLGVLGLGTCSPYMCVMNPPEAKGGFRSAARLCPVCLRKLGTLLGASWEPSAHYEALLAWCRSSSREEDSTWCRERLEVVSGNYFHASTASDEVSAKPNTRNRTAPLTSMPTTMPLPAANLDSADYVELKGCQGALRALNGRYAAQGICNSRRAFVADAGRRRLYFYYLSCSDAWVVGPNLGAEAIFADCGPVASSRDLSQIWRLWDGCVWKENSGVTALPISTQLHEKR